MFSFSPLKHFSGRDLLLNGFSILLTLALNYFSTNIEKLSNFVARGYYSAIVVITTSTIKVAQRWCHKTFLSYTWKSHSNEKGPFIVEQLDWKEEQVFTHYI
jgi:hypothetical protein